MKSAFECSIDEELVNCIFNITGLLERVKRFVKIPEIHLQTAHTYIAEYDNLRNFANISEQQLNFYDKTISKAKRFFEYIQQK